ncbi:hypothetical protein PUW24_15600 [Paenibacillus urinalis]|uniref:Uncharacterized protein n=1 Tax=Paenibacillus urinalis TaxID=521520 RepID=A0AAX3N4Y5_9BACL|nr:MULTISPECIES: hypothetical protein [Paenibacillus]WDH84189.1 hypothetical protein PUW23_08245 [Paenibacillus urinalis]WDH95632.1 hypothetical protein PUW24_15600 [Paenibacillus urinalis]WDI03829.1 hypothetical protein PUW25_07720 [Paenibacillus urinalis]GAK38827.1 hypothetical protein TCA2_0553 [Paenibacillus sp. TCA20]
MKYDRTVYKFIFVVFICIIPIISFQYPVIEGDVDKTHLLKVKGHSEPIYEEPMDNTMSNHPKSMIKSPGFQPKALNETNFLFVMLAVFMLFEYLIINPPFKAYYGLIKRKLYLKPIKFTSMFVSA